MGTTANLDFVACEGVARPLTVDSGPLSVQGRPESNDSGPFCDENGPFEVDREPLSPGFATEST